MKSVQERIAAALERHPDWGDARIMNSLAVPIAAVRAVRAGEPLGSAVSAAPAPSSDPIGLVSLDKIIQKYDIKAAIERELSSLPKGKLLEEGELCRRVAGTDRQRFRRTVENNPDAVRLHRIKLRLDEASEGKFFWGSAADIAEALRIKDL